MMGSTFLVNNANATQVPPYQALDLHGRVVSMTDFRGKVVLLNTWATWCEPCRYEIPYLESLYQNYSSKGLDVVGVSIDSSLSDTKVPIFMKNYGMTYTILRDPDNRFSHVFSTRGVPETFLIDRNGNVVYHWEGPLDVKSNDAELRVRAALGQNIQLSALNSSQNIGLWIASIAGLLSFLSPCVLPLVPAYITFITGLSLKELTATNSNIGDKDFDTSMSAASRYRADQSALKVRTTVITRGGLFILGFSIVFVALGTSAALVSSIFNDSATWIARIGGIVIVLFGLNILGLLRIPRLEKQLKIDMIKKPKHAGSFVVGITFGAGWTPCIGPILAGILTLAASSSSIGTGASLLTAYSAGLAIPFIISAFAVDRFLIFIKRIRKWIPWIERISGILLIAIGILLLSGSFTLLSSVFGGSIGSDGI